MPEKVSDCLRQGAARLEFARAGKQTVVTRAQARSPMRILTPQNAGTAAWAFTSTFGGGLLGGDEITLDVDVSQAATAYVSTQSATKIFRSQDSRVTAQTLTARVAQDGLLILLPDPVSCFAGARYRQTQRIQLAAGGSIIMLDWLTSGRHARGERWAAAECRTSNEIWLGPRCVLRDCLRIAQGTRSLGMSYFNCFATLILLGAHPAIAQARTGTAAEEMLRAPVNPKARTQFGISPLQNGLILRIAGPDVESVAAVVFPFLSFLVDVLGEAPWKRKW